MAANRNSRYYSQSYEAVDNPGHPDHLGQPETSHQPDGDYQDYETYTEPSSGLPPRDTKSKSRKKLYIIGAVVLCVIIGLAVGLGVGLTQKKDTYDYTPAKEDAYVTDSRSFGKGATKESPSNVTDGAGAGTDEYTYYDGPAKNFPQFFQDFMSCQRIRQGPNVSAFKPGISVEREINLTVQG
jgi:hypothetical protein